MSRTDPQSTDQTVDRGGRSVRARLALSGWLLYLLPLCSVCVIGFAVFVVGADSSYQAARLWGGPTRDVERLSFRVQVVQRYYEVERGLGRLQIEVEALDGARSLAHFQGTTDDAGYAEATLRLSAAPAQQLKLQVRSKNQELASGPVDLSVREWQQRARRRGAWVSGSKESMLRVRVHPGRGVFAVPFTDPLFIQVSDAAGPVSGASLTLRPESMAELADGTRLQTGAGGMAKLLLQPRAHVVLLGIEALHRGRTGKWYSTLPVVPGALHASVAGGELRLVSPVPRDEAFYSIVSESARLFGGRVILTKASGGGAAASLALPDGLRPPFWVVVSSEADMGTQAAVGWPVGFEVPTATFDAKDVLLLDGLPSAYERSRERPRRARLLAGLFALLSLTLALVLLTQRVRRADARLVAHFRDEGVKDSRRFRLERSGLMLVVAILCVGLGFVLIALITLARIG